MKDRNSTKVQIQITEMYSDMLMVPMGGIEARNYLITTAFAIANLVRITDLKLGERMMRFIEEELEAHDKYVKEPPPNIGKAIDYLDKESRWASHIADYDNQLKLSFCDKIGEMLANSYIIEV